MTLVFLIYGAAFVVLGVTILTSPRAGLSARWIEQLHWVGLFGLVHGCNEWVDLLKLASPEQFGRLHEFLGPVLLVASFGLLLLYPLSLMRSGTTVAAVARLGALLLLGTCAVLIVTAEDAVVSAHVWGRLLLAGPASTLTGVAMLWAGRELSPVSRYASLGLRAAAVAWLVYALAAGLLPDQADVFLAAHLNQEWFLEATGVPIQVVRAACAVLIGAGVGGAVWRVDQLGKRELRAMRRDLESLVRERTHRLHDANASLRTEVEERERLQAELLKTAKLESLAVFAAGIAHDYNNLMTAVLGNLALARLDLPADSPALESLDQAQLASEMASALAKRLLTFARGGAPQVSPCDVLELVHNAAALSLSGSRVRHEVTAREALAEVEADPGQLSQVLSNLLLNARQAMPDGGTIRIRCDNVHTQLDADAAPRDYVRIEVEDEGHGIPPEVLDRVFDPFFSRREGGTGLGLAVAYSVVRQHHGSITLTSDVGVGTTATVLLPASGQPAARPVASEPGGESPRPYRVLAMDDDPQVLDLLGAMLRRLGCSFTATRTGEEAIASYQEASAAGARFDLVILDLTIRGGMGGREAMARLLELDPGVVAVVSSGYSSDPVAADFVDYGFASSLPKPYTLDDLRRTLRTVLGSAPGWSGDEPAAAEE